LREEVKGRLQDLLDDDRLSQVHDARAHVEVGRPSVEISRFAGQVEADLVVIASHGRNGLDRVLLGSVAEGVLREAECAVLVVRADGKSLLPAASKARKEEVAT
jgi:nucleotide-binding universal stress UspA family protein